MVSSIFSPNKGSRKKEGESSKKKEGESSKKKEGGSGKKKEGGSSKKAAAEAEPAYVRIAMTIYIFRGEPDMWYKRHTLLYFTSPDLPDFFETVHVQYHVDQNDPNRGEWVVDRVHRRVQWDETRTYLTHVNAGALVVYPGQEMAPVDIVAATPVGDGSDEWNCQSFLYEGMQALVAHGYQEQEWYSLVESEMMDALLENNVA